MKSRQEEALENVGQSLDKFDRQLEDSLEQTWNTLVPGFRRELRFMLNAQKDEYGRVIKLHNQALGKLSHKLEEISCFISEKTRQLEKIAETLNAPSSGRYFISGGENEWDSDSHKGASVLP